MPSAASVSIYVPEGVLVSLTLVEIGSCRQPKAGNRRPGFRKYRQGNDTRCRSGTESGDFRTERGKTPRSGKSGRVGRSLVDQQYRDVIADGVDAVAGIALEGFGVGFEDERLLAGRANQDFEEVLRNHDGEIVRRGEGDRRGVRRGPYPQLRRSGLKSLTSLGNRRREWGPSSLDCTRDFGSRLRRRLSASTSTSFG
jgi:hypothetical protein